MITITQTFEDEGEARDAVAWREAYIIIDFVINRLREMYKYEDHHEEVQKMAEKFRSEIINECVEHRVRWD